MSNINLTNAKPPVRFGFYTKSWKTYVMAENATASALYEQHIKLYTCAPSFTCCFGMSLSNTPLMCYDLDGHTEQEAATIEGRKSVLLSLLRSMNLNPAVEKSGRGYHVWLVFDNIPTDVQRSLIHTQVENRLPDIEGRTFDEKRIIRFPGLYKSTGQYGVEDGTTTQFISFKEVKDFFERHMNHLDEVHMPVVNPTSTQQAVVPQDVVLQNNVQPAAIIEKTIDGFRTCNITLERKNFTNFCKYVGFVPDKDGFIPTKVNVCMKTIISTLKKILDVETLNLAVDNFIHDDINGFIRKHETGLSVFCARNPVRPLIDVMLPSIARKLERKAAAAGGDHKRSLTEKYLNIIKQYDFVLDTESDTYVTNKGAYDEKIRAEICVRIERATGTLHPLLMDAVIRDSAREVNGREDLLNTLPAWDGRDRIHDLAQCFTEKESAVRGLSIYRKLQVFLGRAVKRWLCGVQCPVLTLISERQGVGKSTFARWLSNVWNGSKFYTPFAANRIDPTSRDSRVELANVLVRELSELGGLSKHDQKDVKSFLTLERFTDRKAYAYINKTFTPMTVFVATANNDDGIFTDTENRRFLVLNVTHIDLAYQHIDLRQLFAQAKAIDPNLLTISQAELDLLNVDNNQYKKEDLNTTKMRELFVTRPDVDGETPTFYSVAEIARMFENAYGKIPISVTRIMLDIGAGSPKVKRVKIKASSTSKIVRGYTNLLYIGKRAGDVSSDTPQPC